MKFRSISFITAFLLCWPLTVARFHIAQSSQSTNHEVLELKPNRPIERTLKAGETHNYLISLHQGEFIHTEIDQRGIDVVVSLFAPDGTKLVEMNNRQIDYGQEPLSFAATADGNYRIAVSAGTETTVVGHYTIRLVEMRTSKAEDRICIEAERAAAEGQRLRMLGKTESYRDALRYYEAALGKWREIGNRYWEATTLTNVGLVYDNLGERQKALDAYRAALPLSKEVKDVAGEWRIMHNVGVVYDELGERQQALDYYKQAVPLAQSIGDRRGEARTLSNIGRLYNTLGEDQQSLNFYSQALPLWREIGDRSDEADTLLRIGLAQNLLGNQQLAIESCSLALSLDQALGDRSGEALALGLIGSVYSDLGDNQKALDYFNRELLLRHKAGDYSGEAEALGHLGSLYRNLGEYQKALDYYSRAQGLKRAALDSDGEGWMFIFIGMVYSRLADRQKAIEYYNQALPSRRAARDRAGEARVLSLIGSAYSNLGDSGKALDYHQQALGLSRALTDRGREADLLNEIGNDYYAIGDRQKALDFNTQALGLWHALGRRRFESYTLHKLALVYSDLGERQKALNLYNQALQLDRAIGDRTGEAGTLRWIGEVYSSLGEKQTAIGYYNRALLLTRELRDRAGEAITLDSLMLVANALRKPELAIFYGKQAITTYQQLRRHIEGLDKEVQQTYLRSIEVWYRQLADLLIAAGRLPEAQQVLRMLKEEEYFEFVRGDGNEASALKGSADLTSAETAVAKRYNEIADRVTAIGVEYGELRDKKTRTPAEEQKLAKLETDLTVANQAFQTFLDDIDKTFSGSAVGSEKAFQLRESQGLMETLRELGSGAVALYTVVGEDKFRVILVTPDVQKAYEGPIKAADLNRKVLAFREAIQNPHIDPLPLAQELYKTLIGPDLARDLAQAKAQTLMWSLDGVLRYLPIAALHDGKNYLLERYRNVVFTPASQSRLKDPVSQNWKALGLGVSKAQPGFNPLPSVPEELRGIIRDETLAQSPIDSGLATRGAGVLAGRVLLDEAFTESAMLTALRQRYPLVHIASHFQFRPGNETDSFLLLGDGSHLTLARIKSLPHVFSGVDLLTLSACDTATGGSGANGKEVEGFGVLAQRQDAKAVLATLWPVADESTEILMREFYRLHEANPQWTKAEALRQAQLSLLKGGNREDGSATSTQRSSESLNDRSARAGPSFKVDPNAKFSHPYYWAPFILIGNWK